MEQIAMDMGNLLNSQFPDLSPRAHELRNAGLVVRMRAGGAILCDELGIEVVASCGDWTSDTARGWAAMAVGHAPGIDLEQRLDLIRPFADDDHFAVREWAWLSLRPHVAAHLGEAIRLLTDWTDEPSAKLRRFASEVTRPRGVWSAHIVALKKEPARGLPILEPLRADESRYVQDSVGNWLNDASKSQPEWVEGVCRRWETEGASTTARICRRGMRSLARSARSLDPESSILAR
jgi:3-methyladenine DNA glycosylase AlkC